MEDGGEGRGAYIPLPPLPPSPSPGSSLAVFSCFSDSLMSERARLVGLFPCPVLLFLKASFLSNPQPLPFFCPGSSPVFRDPSRPSPLPARSCNISSSPHPLPDEHAPFPPADIFRSAPAPFRKPRPQLTTSRVRLSSNFHHRFLYTMYIVYCNPLLCTTFTAA